MKKLLISIFAITTMLAILWTGIRIYKAIDFDINCGGHLKRAADANTIELAKSELKTSINYIEKHDLTNGVVSIFLKQPKNDMGFWYNNLTASYMELNSVKSDTSLLEKSNMLMKLRETLVDNGKDTTVTIPNGISIYPFNAVFFWWGMLSWIGCMISGVSLFIKWTES